MKPIKFITTFSKTGYEVYGKSWLQSFSDINNLDNISADIYVDFEIPHQQNVNQIDYNKAIPQHAEWISHFNNAFRGADYNKKMGVRFSYKSFVMQHALENNTGCYLVWLDGDCIYKPGQEFLNFAEELLDGKFIAVQREHNGGDDHCESGIVIFDTDHVDKSKFLAQFINNYKIENIINMGSPYDGFIIYRSIAGIDYIDLNAGYGRGGIQSDPNETFLHPEINKRFLHNIGITGKSSYAGWEVHKNSEYFKLIQGRTKKTPEEIVAVRKSLIAKRRNNG